MSVDLSAANAAKEQAQRHYRLVRAMIDSGDADEAWIHIAWAILEEREACARIAETGADFALPQMAEFQCSIAGAIRSRVDP